ncbi:dihydrolipoamide dehydrogenase [Abditibacterium utsteinense]|uniref:Dihydrolipoyl dehydrogenase n=1 Tax=Abditibacterium utsteinense TaxID=1960156 RepID=A0A2S8STH6_9BACT|nr:dihydrolipoyl dehydrogenase [Abditibacterium utsteinense]PQV64086.1 dihydrolipoamide dehydrogenase [Abditibacterium utsteinense]
MSHTKLVVIGGGPGGYAAAFLAADLGIETTLVDLEANPGGVCLYRGCIPSKTLLHAAKVITEAREAAHYGLNFGEPQIDLDKLRGFELGVVQRLTSGTGQLAKARKITYIQGRATFKSNSALKIVTESGEQELTFDKAILATGSRPAKIPVFDIGSERVMDSTAALLLESIPNKLLVIGGGYIGLELGSVYAALGSQVSVVEPMPGLLTGADRDLVAILQKRLEKSFFDIALETKVVELKEVEGGISAKFEGKHPGEAIFDKVLVSVGRTPNTRDLGLENTQIELDKRGFVPVNGPRQTVEPNIYAIGDIAGDPMLAHKASHEGRVAVEHIAGHDVVFEPSAIPAVIFTDPELAWAGLTETQAAKMEKKIKVAKFPWPASGRAVTLDRTDGLTKLILEPETNRILGVGIAGSGAGELIAEGTLAIEMGANADDIKLTIHAHPTLSETVMEAAEVTFGQATHIKVAAPKSN